MKQYIDGFLFLGEIFEKEKQEIFMIKNFFGEPTEEKFEQIFIHIFILSCIHGTTEIIEFLFD